MHLKEALLRRQASMRKEAAIPGAGALRRLRDWFRATRLGQALPTEHNISRLFRQAYVEPSENVIRPALADALQQGIKQSRGAFKEPITRGKHALQAQRELEDLSNLHYYLRYGKNSGVDISRPMSSPTAEKIAAHLRAGKRLGGVDELNVMDWLENSAQDILKRFPEAGDYVPKEYKWHMSYGDVIENDIPAKIVTTPGRRQQILDRLAEAKEKLGEFNRDPRVGSRRLAESRAKDLWEFSDHYTPLMMPRAYETSEEFAAARPSAVLRLLEALPKRVDKRPDSPLLQALGTGLQQADTARGKLERMEQLRKTLGNIGTISKPVVAGGAAAYGGKKLFDFATKEPGK